MADPSNRVALQVAGSTVLGTAALVYFWKRYHNSPPLSTELEREIEFDDKQYGGLIAAQVLVNHGVKKLYTLTGGHIAPILVGSKALGIKVVDVRDEVTAAFAADATSRLIGVPGVACVTAGPGLTNVITAVKNAQLAQSPLVLLGGATTDILKGRGSLQDIDQRAMLEPHVKCFEHVSCVGEIAPALERAFAVSMAGTPGPVMVEFPLDLLYPEATVRQWYEREMRGGTSIGSKLVAWYVRRHVNRIFDAPQPLPLYRPLLPVHPLAGQAQVARARNYLLKAQRPVLVIGSQAVLDLAGIALLVKAVESLGMPTYLSSMARGLLGADHPLQMRHRRSVALRQADVCVLAGVTCDFRLGYGQSISSGAVLISANRDPVDLRKNRTPTLGILADPSQFLRQLATVLADSTAAQWEPWMAVLRDHQAAREKEIDAMGERECQFMNAVKVCRHIDAALTDSSVLVADGGDFVGTASYIVQPRSPLSWLDPGVFGTLGVGAGFAVAAAESRPNSVIWCLYGDGAFGWSIAEIDTWVRFKLPIVAVIGNDACWMQIRRDQHDVFGDDVAAMLRYTSYERVAEGFDAKGFLVQREEDLPGVLAQAQEIALGGCPVIVNCLLDRLDLRRGSASL